ncbi:MAG: hypothetical protein K9I68_07985 [Bacteroidales bacterium]|nr:hypothetical protein [Bacteroidales bacterium]MCF8338389.1 hypothetical protein [Bacteroidales bacterium]
MNSKEFLNKKLDELAFKFDTIKIRYEYRKSTNSHLIEVLPSDVFNDNEAYINEEIAIRDYFEESFPNENIVFISEDSLSEIKNPEKEYGYDKIHIDINCQDFDFDIEGVAEYINNSETKSYAIAA